MTRVQEAKMAVERAEHSRDLAAGHLERAFDRSAQTIAAAKRRYEQSCAKAMDDVSRLTNWLATTEASVAKARARLAEVEANPPQMGRPLSPQTLERMKLVAEEVIDWDKVRARGFTPRRAV